MITDKLIIRKADNILYPNEVADFKAMCFSPLDNISAISVENIQWMELSGSRYRLLSYVCNRIDKKITKIKVMIYLYNQPNTLSIKHKGGWGLLKSQIDVDNIETKKEIVFEEGGKLSFILEGVIDVQDCVMLKGILSVTDVVYFSTNEKSDKEYRIEKYDDWVNYRLSIGSIVLFFLGLGIEPACELVAMKKSKDILELF